VGPARFEQQGDRAVAVKAYSQVAQWDFNYRDVQGRIKNLRGGGPGGSGTRQRRPAAVTRAGLAPATLHLTQKSYAFTPLPAGILNLCAGI
jgi:hypothetical protein